MAFGFSSVANASGWSGYDATGWIGPHLNLHFGSGKVEFSLGVEASYWRTLNDTVLGPGGFQSGGGPDIVKLGADLGTEYNFSRKKWLHYAEAQLGIFGLAGFSLGLAIDDEYGVGLQSSLWANWLVGGLLRFRHFREPKKHNDYSLGTYIKGPYLLKD